MSDSQLEYPPGPRPRIDSESAGLADNDSRHTNAARALALGAMLSGRVSALDGISSDIRAIGTPSEFRRPVTWEERLEAIAESSELLRGLGAGDLFAEERAPRRSIADRSVEPRFADQRVALWGTLSRAGTAVPSAYAWLRLLMAEHDPLLCASASSALSHWRRPTNGADVSIPPALSTATSNVQLFVSDSDPLVNEIAQATIGVPSPSSSNIEAKLHRMAKREDQDELSLIVHGTHAYPSTWWFPGGDFHSYVKDVVCSNIYDQQDAYSWSGRYKSRDRVVAAERLVGWHQAKGTPTLDAVFAHSYGGGVALQATTFGLEVENLILLSAPVENYEIEWRNIGRAVSLRIHCDLVLLAARVKQCFTANVEEHWIDNWFIHHSMSHAPDTWASGNWASTLGLT
jgi:hypothetical protein